VLVAWVALIACLPWALDWININRALFDAMEGRRRAAMERLEEVHTRTGTNWGAVRARRFWEEMVIERETKYLAGNLFRDRGDLIGVLLSYLAQSGEIYAPGELNPDSLVWLGEHGPLLAKAFPLYSSKKWRELHDLLREVPIVPPDGARPGSWLAAREIMRARAAFECADWPAIERMAPWLGRTLLPHWDAVGPFVAWCSLQGRGDEALLTLWRQHYRFGYRVSAPSMSSYLEGPMWPGDAELDEGITRSSRIEAWMERPEDSLTRALLPADFKFVPATESAPVDHARASNSWASVSKEGGVVVRTNPASSEPLMKGLVAGTLTLTPFQAPPWQRVTVWIDARGQSAMGEWPVLLLVANGASVSEILVGSDTSSRYRRSFNVDGRLRSLSLIYVNNALPSKPPANSDRNVWIDEVWLAPATD